MVVCLPPRLLVHGNIVRSVAPSGATQIRNPARRFLFSFTHQKLVYLACRRHLLTSITDKTEKARRRLSASVALLKDQ